MMTYSSLKLAINDALIGFLGLYPVYEKYRERIFEITEKNMLLSQADRKSRHIKYYFNRYQLQADITIEITKAAMQFREFSESKKSPLPQEPNTPKTTTHFSYDKRGNVIYCSFGSNRLVLST